MNYSRLFSTLDSAGLGYAIDGEPDGERIETTHDGIEVWKTASGLTLVGDSHAQWAVDYSPDMQPEQNDVGAYVYQDGTEWPMEDTGCVDIADLWHGGQWTALYALISRDFSPANIMHALYELETAFRGAPDSQLTDAEYASTASAIEELTDWHNATAHLLAE